MDFLFNINVQFYILSYLVGGIPFGLVFAKLFTGKDIREAGSGSIGATNVLRVLKETNPALAKKLAILTVILDALKGIVILLIAKIIGLDISTLWAIAVFSVLGHCYSPYLKFEGGKGVATGAGVLLVMLPIETLIAFLTWFVVGKVLKISSLSSLLALIALIASSYVMHHDLEGIQTHAPLWMIAFIIVYKHIPNIVRLFQGKESKVI
ncbi:glycerol-3-phosphate 1-O-acyltransferase PlsY [Sulfurospirillum barnesii]|uniref:Glycerol-3-phosphate acyltransferase n=1 Tax=Sulfurospirillum barnesii (strain ATCC 700032 / DSM 10660 / SES-3) TaxID=760154 RepID=I3XUF8_SULBS|nr:glycerol-3-phosphate 1-O-acyltransferase PlsY [Sulfurospirillum barnesii]AFL67582.1 acyl-phosphate glycerol-3-phosphate acyltransferase [Sulfurospirillum barnesii SES-3]